MSLLKEAIDIITKYRTRDKDESLEARWTNIVEQVSKCSVLCVPDVSGSMYVDGRIKVSIAVSLLASSVGPWKDKIGVFNSRGILLDLSKDTDLIDKIMHVKRIGGVIFDIKRFLEHNPMSAADDIMVITDEEPPVLDWYKENHPRLIFWNLNSKVSELMATNYGCYIRGSDEETLDFIDSLFAEHDREEPEDL